MAGPLIEIEHLVKRYGALTAVDDLSFEVRAGEMFGLIGPDGAGKTTALRVALGLLRPDAGQVLTCGLDPRRQHRLLTQRVGYLAQRFSLYGDLTVDENIGFFAEMHGVRDYRQRRTELLEMVRMTPFRGRLADRLSGGMRQKLALACTLIHTPELLVLDEPTTGVDPVSRRDFWKLLARLKGQGLTIWLTTPYLDEAERCERVALVDHGRLLLMDAPDALRRQDGGVLLEIVARPFRAAAELLRRQPGVADVEIFGERLHVTTAGLTPSEAEGFAQGLRATLQGSGVEVDLVRPTLPALEDVFIRQMRVHATESVPAREEVRA